MFTVICEYIQDGKRIQLTYEDVYADTEQEASDIAYERTKRENPRAAFVDILQVFDNESGV